MLLSKLLQLTVTVLQTLTTSALVSNIQKNPTIYNARQEDISCHYPDKHPQNREGTDQLSKNPPSEKSVIFIETSCKITSRGFFSLNPRQACAVESAAKHNPEYQIHVLILGPRNSSTTTLHNILKQKYGVQFHQIDLFTYIAKTPVMDLVRTKLRYSKFSMSHLSDVMRFLTLWKYAGVYMDLDVVVVKPLKQLPACFVGEVDSESLGAGFLAFNRSAYGRYFTDKLVREIALTYDGSQWGFNGPGVISRVVKRLCPFKKTWPSRCFGLHILGREYLYPVAFKDWQLYVDKGSSRLLARYSSERVHAHHVWNLRSHGVRLPADSLYAALAKINCPTIYALTNKDF